MLRRMKNQQHMAMPKYLFTFGYETPIQAKNNNQYGLDDEDSLNVFIKAENELQALEWGREIAEDYVRKLYQDPAISWKAQGFSHWIEKNLEKYGQKALSKIPTVKTGEYPKWVV